MNYRWIKIRTCHAWGYGEWEYLEVPASKEFRHGMGIKEWLEEVHQVRFGMDDDKYRGAEWKAVPYPPLKLLEREEREARGQAVRATRRVERYAALLKVMRKMWPNGQPNCYRCGHRKGVRKMEQKRCFCVCHQSPDTKI